MPSPLFIGGIVVLGSVGLYELYTKVFKKPADGTDAAAAADTSAAPAAQAPFRPSAPGAPGTGKRPPGTSGMDPRFLAAHPQWAGWSKGMPTPINRPSPPALRSAAMRAATTTPIVGGRPVMSGDVAKSLGALLAWHGVDPADAAVVKRFQQSVGLNPDGKFGPQTASALATALQALGIPMPSVVPAGRQGVAPPMAAPAAPARDHNIVG
jgi:hypothetical protein